MQDRRSSSIYSKTEWPAYALTSKWLGACACGQVVYTSILRQRHAKVSRPNYSISLSCPLRHPLPPLSLVRSLHTRGRSSPPVIVPHLCVALPLQRQTALLQRQRGVSLSNRPPTPSSSLSLKPPPRATALPRLPLLLLFVVVVIFDADSSFLPVAAYFFFLLSGGAGTILRAPHYTFGHGVLGAGGTGGCKTGCRCSRRGTW